MGSIGEASAQSLPLYGDSEPELHGPHGKVYHKLATVTLEEDMIEITALILSGGFR